MLVGQNLTFSYSLIPIITYTIFNFMNREYFKEEVEEGYLYFVERDCMIDGSNKESAISGFRIYLLITV